MTQVFIVLICMGIIVSKASVHWGDAFDGFIPSKVLVSPEGLYTCALCLFPLLYFAYATIFLAIGILGATVMPHSLFLGSALATQERETEDMTSEERPRGSWSWGSGIASAVKVKACSSMSKMKAGITKDSVRRAMRRAFYMGRVHHDRDPPRNHAEHENHSASFVERHLTHGTVDMVVSLLGIALVINALYALFNGQYATLRLTFIPRIVVLASAVFYYGPTGPSDGPATLFDAYDLLEGSLGKGMPLVRVHESLRLTTSDYSCRGSIRIGTFGRGPKLIHYRHARGPSHL